MPYRKGDRRVDQQRIADERRKSDADRRRYQRILIDLEVDYQCEETFLFAYITDMSALGIFIRTNNPETPGTHLNLRFTLPGDECPLEVEGEVIWINPYRPGNFESINPGMGVRFVDFDRDLKRRLMVLVRKIAYLEEQENSEEDADDAEDKAEDEASSSEVDAEQRMEARRNERHEGSGLFALGLVSPKGPFYFN